MVSSHEQRLSSILTSLRAAACVPRRSREDKPSPNPPTASTVRFVTISRQAGAGGKSLATELADALNRAGAEGQPWCAWDRDLVDKVVSEHRIPNEFVEALEDANHRWPSELFSSFSDRPEEFKVYRRVAMTIRALAEAGRAVIVGRGGVFITAGLLGGIHVRLVAPIDFRIAHMASRLNISPKEAAARVHEIDRNRLSFYRQHWPGKDVESETFTITFNTEQLSEAQMVACLVPLIAEQQPTRPTVMCRSSIDKAIVA